MPTITVYLNNELFDYVKEDTSKRIQKALREMKERENAEKEDDKETDN